MSTWTTDGHTSLGQAAALFKTSPGTILRLTMDQAQGPVLPAGVAEWLNRVFTGDIGATEAMPPGITFWLPG
jgi:hypothetical protein